LQRLQRAILDGVFNQVEENRFQAVAIGEHVRQNITGNDAAGGIDIWTKLSADLAHQRGTIGAHELVRLVRGQGARTSSSAR
jgi:hypothetical protein